MTGFGQPAQLLGIAWHLPAILVALWLALVVLQRRSCGWYFVVATGVCSAVPLIACAGALVLGHPSGPAQGADMDILIWSFLSVFTGLGTVITLLLLTGIIELVRLSLSLSLLPQPLWRNDGSVATVTRLHHAPEVASRFHGRSAATEMTRLKPQETHFAVRHQWLKPVTVDQGGEDPSAGADLGA